MLHQRTPDTHADAESAVIDDKGNKVGRVIDAVYDLPEGGPDFLVVDPGRFRACRYVPVQGTYTTLHGEVVVPFEKWWVMCSPKAAKGRVISRKTHAQLDEHYGPLYDWRRTLPEA